jgi:hypothetical protein
VSDDLRGAEELCDVARGVDVGASLRTRFTAGGGETSSLVALRLVYDIVMCCLLCVVWV